MERGHPVQGSKMAGKKPGGEGNGRELGETSPVQVQAGDKIPG